MSTKREHPEQQDNEVFAGNTEPENWPRPHLCGFKNVRLGRVAYDLDGKAVPYMRPIFVHDCDYPAYDRAQLEHLSQITCEEAA